MLITPLEAHLEPANNTIIKKQHALILLGAGISQSTTHITPGLFAYPRIVEAARIYHLGYQNGIHYLIFISGGAKEKDCNN